MTRSSDDGQAAALALAQDLIQDMADANAVDHVERISTFVLGFYAALKHVKIIDFFEEEKLGGELSQMKEKHLQRLADSARSLEAL